MTRDDIIRMAVSAGFFQNDKGTITSPFIEDICILELLTDFANDVAAAEREACAKVCDDLDDDLPDGLAGWQYCEAIRARGEQ